MNRVATLAGVVCLLAGAQARADDPALSVTVGARLWYAQWTTFSYFPGIEGQPAQAMTEVSAPDKVVVMPVVGVRYGDVFGSASAFTSTRFAFDNGSNARRSEFDANAGYSVMPNLALTLGYKSVSQTDGSQRYRPRGPVLGASANAPLGSGLSLYGSLGIGWLKTPAGDAISFRTGYRLAEVGLAYAFNTERPRWTLTGGYRIQVLTSKDAFEGQDGRDTTQGFTLGVNATF